MEEVEVGDQREGMTAAKGAIPLDMPVPKDWSVRPHQTKLWTAMHEGCLRAIGVWHRRAGKDSTALNWTCCAMLERVGTYWHMLPEAAQARKAVWEGRDKEGRRIIDQAFPPELRARTVDNEMLIEFKNGSIWQLVGSDNYNSLVGSNPVGVVFSEYSIGNPAAWDYIRPILAENGGWAIFIYTPRGKNHGHKLYTMAAKNEDWFVELLTVQDTGIISPEAVQAERDAGMDDDMIEQEFYCSFEGVKQGSIFGSQMARMRAAGRIGKFPYDRRYPVNTFWDIGHSDTTAIVAHQQVGAMDRFLWAYEKSGEDVAHFVQKLSETGYLWGEHYLPHDAKNVTLAAKSNPLGSNVWNQCFALGLRNLKLVPRVKDVWTGINETRTRLDTVEIDEEGCANLISAMESYHKKWVEELRTYRNEPVHDWSSNYCDAVRQWAQGWKGATGGGQFTRPNVVHAAPQHPGVPAQRLPPQMRTIGSRRAGY